jgi:hypothetical protein
MKFDLHFHTTASDGVASPEKMITMLRSRGLDGFSITDHDTVGDPETYQILAKRYGLIFVCGIEITAREGHLLAYCGPKEIGTLKEFKPGEPVSFYVDACAQADIIISPAHPFDYFRHGIGNLVYQYRWSALETFNGSTVFPFSNKKAEQAAERLTLPQIGGSDAHTHHYVGFAYTEADAHTGDELLKKIQENKTSVGGNHLNIFQFTRRMLEIKILK